MLHTILGAGGVIGNELAKELTQRGEKIRFVSRNPKNFTGVNAELHSADLLDAAAVSEAVRGSSVVYLTAGLPYKFKVWQQNWPIVMQNAIDAAKRHNAKLIFFDNVYMYGKVNGKMTEQTPYNPTSRKGEVRARIATMLMDEVQRGNLQASIARAADFYGPATPLSMLTSLVFDNFKKGKSAQLMLSDKFPHSFTFTPDCGVALANMAADATSFNQIWHLPTANPAPTGREIVGMAAAAMDVAPKYSVLGRTMLKIIGLFVPVVGEMGEMLYQYDAPYWFDSTKFEQHFGQKPTPYTEGLQLTGAFYKNV